MRRRRSVVSCLGQFASRSCNRWDRDPLQDRLRRVFFQEIVCLGNPASRSGQVTAASAPAGDFRGRDSQRLIHRSTLTTRNDPPAETLTHLAHWFAGEDAKEFAAFVGPVIASRRAKLCCGASSNARRSLTPSDESSSRIRKRATSGSEGTRGPSSGSIAMLSGSVRLTIFRSDRVKSPAPWRSARGESVRRRNRSRSRHR